MRHHSLPKYIILSVILCIGLAAAVALGSQDGMNQWAQLTSSKEYNSFYDTASLARPRKGVVMVWTKAYLSPACEAMRQVRGLLLSEKKSPDDFGYLTSLTEVDCTHQHYRILANIFISKDQNVLSSMKFPDAEWSAISSGSSVEVLRKAVCKK